MRLLVLGGTAWLGGEVARTGVAAGHEVVCLARGSSGAPPAGVEFVVGDRSTEQGYAGLSGSFDAVVDVARDPQHVRTALSVLGSRVGHWVFVSTINVYADAGPDAVGADESAALLEPWTGTDWTPEVYGAGKVTCEQSLVAELGARRVLIARAGLIAGPGDITDRTGYWPLRFAHPSRPDDAVLVPDVSGAQVQLIDVRDLAGWLVKCAAQRRSGVFNATGPSVPLQAALATARSVAGHTGPTIPVSADWLVQHGVQHWMGERSLPLWLPCPQLAGMMTVSRSAAAAAGLTVRPLPQTFRDGLAWEMQTGPGRARGAGLSPADEQDLITVRLSER